MRLSFRSGIPGLSLSRARWLQLAAFGVLAWAWLQSGPQTSREAPPPAEPAPATTPAVSAEPAAASPITGSEQAAESAEVVPDSREQSAGLGFSTIEVIVSHNDTLDRIFRRLQLNVADLASLRTLPGLKSHLDRLRPGEALTLQHRDGELLGFERRLSPSETLKVVKEDTGFFADVLENPLEKRVRTVHGRIDHSLFAAVTSAGAHDQTALALSEIFGWDIDFVLDIHPGDTFSVTYEELMQDGEYVKDGPVLAARFINQGREYHAVRYVDPNGGEHYYSPDGRSLRKAFLRAPLEFTRVSSGFNLKRRHPVLNRIRAHKGVDYAAPTGTPVRAAGDGRIRFAGKKGGYGNVVEIDHARGVVTLYAHLHRFSSTARVGKRVKQGSIIGYVGMTGLASGPHLHYEYRLNGVHKNPQTIKLREAVPIDARWRDDFEATAGRLLASLDAPVGPLLVAR